MKLRSKVFGDFLKSSRIKAGLTQKEVSTVMGYSTSQFVSNWERGMSTPPIKDLKKLARTLKVDPMLMLNEITKHELQWVKVKIAQQFQRSK